MIDVILGYLLPPIENRWFQDDRYFLDHIKDAGNGRSSKLAASFTDNYTYHFNSKTTTEAGGKVTFKSSPLSVEPLNSTGFILFGSSKVL